MPHLRFEPRGSGASFPDGAAAGRAGRVIPLTRPVVTIGRHPDCEVVLDNPAVSRRHARLIRDGAGYQLEDLGSRNATLLDGAPVDGRVTLTDGAAVRVCDVTLRFFAADPPGRPAGPVPRGAGGPPDLSDSDTRFEAPVPNRPNRAALERRTDSLPSAPGGRVGPADPEGPGAPAPRDTQAVLAAVPAARLDAFRLDVNPEAKLRAVLAITRALAGSDGLDRVLDRTLESLFQVFPQADRGFVLLAGEPGAEPVVRATRSRATVGGGGGTVGGDGEGGEVRISRTIVRRVLERGEAILSGDAGADGRFEGSASLSDLRIRSVVCVPLRGRGEAAFGVLQLDTTDVSRQFAEGDLDLLLAVAAPVGLAAENARLTAEAAVRREAERDLELAARIQQGFLPQSPPPLPGYEFADKYESAQSVGGDYFDYVPLPDGRVAVALGDVAGKGIPAALVMARMSAAARAHLLGAAGKRSADLLPSAVKRLNAELSDGRMGHRFVTCVVLLIDPKTHTLYAVNAGHMAPLIRTAGGTVEPLGEVSGGMPLGIDGEQRFEVASRVLRPGEGALVFTDGITEAVREGADAHTGSDAAAGLDARAKGLYGRERLAAVFGRTRGTAGEVIAAVASDVAAWTGCGPQTDDVCLVAVRRSEDPAAETA